jgi:hypothetical protein
LFFDIKRFDGGRTRARTLDPLIKSKRWYCDARRR